MTTQAKCCQCGHELPAQPPPLSDADRSRLVEIERELAGLAFEQGRLAECERTLRRERFEIENKMSGGAGAGGEGSG